MKTEMIRELRAITQAGMQDCKEALLEANWDLQKAVDIIKIKGKNITSNRQGKLTSEGIIVSETDANISVLVEVNCQTDFVAKSPEFYSFAQVAAKEFLFSIKNDTTFDYKSETLEQLRTNLVASTKENIVIRNWWAEETSSITNAFTYVHANNQIGVLLTLSAPENILKSDKFNEIGNNLAMQIAAMNPIAISSEFLTQSDLDRQTDIFLSQIENPSEEIKQKILTGKLKKWYTEVCLLEQNYLFDSKLTVNQALMNVDNNIIVVNFIRAQVGAGIEKPVSDLKSDVVDLLK